MLRDMCRKLSISESDIAILMSVEANIQYIADLVAADIFIDCFYRGESKGIVVAQAKPSNAPSLYKSFIVGEYVYIENEPAVFTVKETKTPARDIIAKTQENKLVKQSIVPIISPCNEIIGVLICEYDVSESVLQDKKYKVLGETVERLKESLSEYDGIASPYATSAKNNIQQKEIHHRVKNNLQMVASILNIQARRTEIPELKLAFKENVNRILSIAAIHDILTYNDSYDNLSIKKVIEQVIHNMNMYNDANKNIDINILGEDLVVASEKGVSIAIIINELLTNSLKHGFSNRTEGHITVSINPGSLYTIITVSDDGNGFDTENLEAHSFGLELVKLTVTDKLKGKLQIHSEEGGTRITFDFRN